MITSYYHTTREVAEVLGVSQHQVCQLVKSGELQAEQTPGGHYLVDVRSAIRYKIIYAGKGRPLSPSQAFGALFLLSGIEPAWLSKNQLARADELLQKTTPERLVWITRKRKTTYVVPKTQLTTKPEDRVKTGLSALRKARIGLTVQNGPEEIYVLDENIHGLGSIQNDSHNRQMCIVHVIKDKSESNWFKDLDVMPDAIVAADLAESIDPRTRLSGIKRLEELIDEYRNIHG